MTNIIVPGALNEDPTQWTYVFEGGPLHGSKLPVHPKIVRMGMEVGLEVGGKMQVYKPVDREKSDGKKYRVYVYSGN
jgi:hypothetical protein